MRKDKRGRWYYRVRCRLPDGRRLRISGVPRVNTKAAAETAERGRVMAIYQRGEDRPPAPRFDEFAKRWLEKYPAAVNNRKSERETKNDHVRLHLIPYFGDTPIDEIRGEKTTGFFAALDDKGLSEKTAKNLQTTLRRILASAVEWGELEAVPLLPKIKVPEPEFDWYTREESKLLFAAARDPEERALLVFAVHTGARLGEQLAFEWGDIDWQSGKVLLRRARVRGEVGPTKSGKGRSVPMTETCRDALQAIKHLRGQLVFCRMDGKPFTKDQLHEKVWAVQRRAGLWRIRWHDLRHSFGSQLASAGVPLRQIQEWMGHSTIAMTERYSHMAPGGDGMIHALDSGQPAGSGFFRASKGAKPKRK